MDSKRCLCMTRRGTQCSRMAIEGDDFCYQHNKGQCKKVYREAATLGPEFFESMVATIVKRKEERKEQRKLTIDQIENYLLKSGLFFDPPALERLLNTFRNILDMIYTEREVVEDLAKKAFETKDLSNGKLLKKILDYIIPILAIDKKVTDDTVTFLSINTFIGMFEPQNLERLKEEVIAPQTFVKKEIVEGKPQTFIEIYRKEGDFEVDLKVEGTSLLQLEAESTEEVLTLKDLTLSKVYSLLSKLETLPLKDWLMYLEENA